VTLPGLVIPPYESAVAPVTIPALAGAVLAAIVVGFFLTVAGLVVGAGSLVARFHRARGVERQQRRSRATGCTTLTASLWLRDPVGDSPVHPVAGAARAAR
jgi:tellurite resistance protein TehA-like permease